MKMTTISLIVIFAILFVACTKKMADKTTETVTEVPPVPATKPVEEPTKSDVKPYVMLNYKKTPCYGKCPIYEANFYTDGRATYKGKNFVDHIGDFETTISKEDVKMIKQKFLDIDFLTLANEYPIDGPKIADLPSTIMDFRVGDMIKQVRDKHDAPKKLKELEKWMEEYINGLKWVEVIKD